MTLKIQSDVNIAELNTMRVPARARFLTKASGVSDLRQALEYVKKHKFPLCILGQGSNTLFIDDFDGLLVLNQLKGIELLSQTNNSVVVKVAAGENWHEFVDYCLSQDWYGLENLALIPGLVGAAPIQNIGAYGVELSDTLVSLEYLDRLSGQLISMKSADCKLAYRDSIFKHQLFDKAIITSVTLELSKIHQPTLAYPALRDKLAEGTVKEHPSARQIFDAVCSIRSSKLPDPKKIPNLGSFFKNPLVERDKLEALSKQYPEIVSYPTTTKNAEADCGQYKLAAAWLIDRAGWKNKAIDGVAVHQSQALVITNPSGASGHLVHNFAQAIQADIELKFGLILEIEPRLIASDGLLSPE